MKVGPLRVVLAARTLLMARALAAELPHALIAETLILPLVNKASFTATVIVLVLEVPVRPAGNTQL
jgi:hypothetical protein